MDVSAEMVGLDAVLEKLKEVEYDARYKGGRFALRKAANVVRDQAIANAQKLDDPETANSIAKNISVRWSGKLFRTTGNPGFRVGILGGARDMRAYGEFSGKGKKNPGGDTFYWRFLEFGTEKMPAHPFLRAALSENVAKATQEFVTEYGKALDRAIKRAKK